MRKEKRGGGNKWLNKDNLIRALSYYQNMI
jgi:hypothetical protein